MNLISFEKTAKAYGPRVLLDGVSLGVDEGMRIGVVGRNGAGKSTLLALLAGAAEPDNGRIARMSGLRVGYLPQSDALSGTVGQVAFGDRAADGVWERDPLSRSVAHGAALRRSAWRPTWRTCPAASAGGSPWRPCSPPSATSCSSTSPPTTWISRPSTGLAGTCGTAAARWSLSATTAGSLTPPATRSWEVADGQVYQTEGGYSAYVLAQAERQAAAEADEQRRRNLARKELAWLRRGPQARSTKPKFRVRGGQRADRRRAARPGRHRAGPDGDRPARQDRPRTRGRVAVSPAGRCWTA